MKKTLIIHTDSSNGELLKQLAEKLGGRAIWLDEEDSERLLIDDKQINNDEIDSETNKPNRALRELEQAVREMNLIRQGKLKTIRAEDLLNEL